MRRSLPEVLVSLVCNLMMLAAVAWIAYQILRLLFQSIKILLGSLKKIPGPAPHEMSNPADQNNIKIADLKTPIYVARNGTIIHESIDDAGMRRLIRNKSVTSSDYYFREGMKDWKPVSQYTASHRIPS